MNNEGCEAGYTNVNSSCYKCSDPYATPTFDNNIDKVVCNSKPTYFYGPTYSEESSIWSVTPFTGQLQCNNNSEIKMIDSGDSSSPWIHENKEPMCQQVLPSIIDIKYKGSNYTICGTRIPISKELCGQDPKAGLDVTNEKALDSDGKVKCGMGTVEATIEFDKPIDSVVFPEPMIALNPNIDIQSNIATITLNQPRDSNDGRCTSTEETSGLIPFLVDGQVLTYNLVFPANE
jgi:hypothetical protein